jgi:hypothetical protein
MFNESTYKEFTPRSSGFGVHCGTTTGFAVSQTDTFFGTNDVFIGRTSVIKGCVFYCGVVGGHF